MFTYISTKCPNLTLGIRYKILYSNICHILNVEIMHFDFLHHADQDVGKLDKVKVFQDLFNGHFDNLQHTEYGKPKLLEC